MWSALSEPGVSEVLDRIDAAARDAIVDDLRRTQGSSWRTHAKLGPGLAVVALAWWDGIAAQESVDRVAIESWLAIVESAGANPLAAAAAVHGFLRLRDVSKVLTYQHVFQKLAGVLAKPMCAALVGLDSPTRVFVVRWVAENAPEQGEESLVRCAGDPSRGIREAALGGLRRLGPRVIARVAEHLASPDTDVRRAIVLFLKGLEHRDALEPLRAALKKEKSSPLKTELQKAILACGGSVAASAPTSTVKAATERARTTKTKASNLIAAIEAEPAPRLPRFVTELPKVHLRLREGGELSDKAIRWLLYRLTLEQHDLADPESRALRTELVDDDCHELSRILSDAFASRGSRADDKWLVYQRSILGKEEQALDGVEGLEQLVTDNGFARATWTLDILARYASPGALYWLDYFARSSRSEAVRDAATTLLHGVRSRLGADEVQRRVDSGLPVFPFDEAGRWLVGPGKEVTLSGDGRVDHEPRKKSAFDANELAEIGRCRRAVERAGRSLERAMCEGRTWNLEAFRATFDRHPIARVLGRTLLFLDDSSSKLFHLHPASGATDVSGESFALSSNAIVRIVHPIDLRGRSTASEYARLQRLLATFGPPPFSQLDREVFVIDDYRRGEDGVELDSPSLPPSSTLRFLQRRGWVTEEDSDDTARETVKTLPEGWTAWLGHTDIDVRYLGGRPSDDLAELGTEDGSIHFESLALDGPSGAKIWDAPAIVFSEVMRDVELAIRAGAPES